MRRCLIWESSHTTRCALWRGGGSLGRGFAWWRMAGVVEGGGWRVAGLVEGGEWRVWWKVEGGGFGGG